MVSINNINSYDLMLINNKGSPNNTLLGENEDYKNIDESVRNYKFEIQTKIDRLLNSYLENNEKPKTYNKKYKHHFHNFLMSVIEATERQEMKNLVSNDLSGITNNVVINTDDMSYNMLSIDMNLMDKNKNTTKKIGNLNSFVINPIQITKILPQIAMKR